MLRGNWRAHCALVGAIWLTLLSSGYGAAYETPNLRPPVATQQPHPSPHATKEKKPADQPTLGSSARSSLYVNAKCGHGCGYSESREGWWKKLWTDPVATFTAVLAFFTIVLAVATIRAANAAKIAADALPNLERAYLYAIGTPFGLVNRLIPEKSTDGVAKPGERRAFETHLRVTNYGRTPAILCEKWVVNIPIPEGLPVFPPPDFVSLDQIIQTDKDATIKGQSDWFDEGEFNDINSNANNRFVFRGIVRYLDVFRKRHDLSFCYEIAKRGSVKRRIGGDALNYEK